MDAQIAMSSIQFLTTVGKLKHLKRTGWVHKAVEEPETVASHMYRMAIMGMMIPDSEAVDKIKVIKMALVHDMAEAIVGDITPHCGVSDVDKFTLEKQALEEMTGKLPDQKIATEIMALWQEYEGASTAEAKFVKDFDKFDMELQAYEYETDQPKIRERRLQEFFDSTNGIFRTEMVRNWDKTLRETRQSSLDKDVGDVASS